MIKKSEICKHDSLTVKFVDNVPNQMWFIIIIIQKKM